MNVTTAAASMELNQIMANGTQGDTAGQKPKDRAY